MQYKRLLVMRGSMLVVTFPAGRGWNLATNICPYTISGSFSQNLVKTNISFVTSIPMSVFVRVSVCVKHGFHWTDIFMKYDMSIFRKSVDTTVISLQSDMNNGHCT